MSRGTGRPKHKSYVFTDSQARWLVEQMDRLQYEFEFVEDRRRAREIMDRMHPGGPLRPGTMNVAARDDSSR